MTVEGGASGLKSEIVPFVVGVVVGVVGVVVGGGGSVSDMIHTDMAEHIM